MASHSCWAHWVTAGFSVSNNTWTSMPLGGEDLDTDAYHDNTTNNSRVTIPSGRDGRYLVIGQVAWNGAGTGLRGARVMKNGATSYSEVKIAPGTVTANGASCFAVLDLVSTDYVEVQGIQTSGGSLTGYGSLAVIYLGTSIRACYAYTTTGNTGTSGSYTAVNLDAEGADSTGAMHNLVTNNSRITVPATSKYLVLYSGVSADTSASLVSKARKNGTTDLDGVMQDVNSSGQEVGGMGFCVADLTASDYIETYVFQDFGSGKTIKGALAVIELTATQKYAEGQRATTDQSMGTATFTDVQFNTELFDSDTMHDNTTNNARLTVNSAGDWLLLGQLLAGAPGSGNQTAGLRFHKTGASLGGGPEFNQNLPATDPAQNTKRLTWGLTSATTSDYFTMQGYTDPGGNAIVGTLFAAVRMDDWNVDTVVSSGFVPRVTMI